MPYIHVLTETIDHKLTPDYETLTFLSLKIHSK